MHLAGGWLDRIVIEDESVGKLSCVADITLAANRLTRRSCKLIAGLTNIPLGL